MISSYLLGLHTRRNVGRLISVGWLRNINYYLNLVPFCMLHWVHFIIICFLQCRLCLWAASLCMTIASHFWPRWRRVGVLESVTGVLGLFYLNRHLTLFGHSIPVMLLFFGRPPTQTKLGWVSCCPSMRGRKMLKRSLSDVSFWWALVVESTDIFVQLPLPGMVSCISSCRDSDVCFL